MLRDPNLIPLSHQHRDGLALCVLTRRSLRADSSPANLARLAAGAIDSYEMELAGHFEIEEQILFPAIEGEIGNLPLIGALIAQHRLIEAQIAELRSAPSEPLLERFCALLNAHIRSEENELFQIAQARLPEPLLRELGAAIREKAVRICF